MSSSSGRRPGRYAATLDHSWDLVPLPQGGIIASFALRASAAEVADPTQELRTCTAIFAGQVAAGDLEVDVDILRRGRSATQVHRHGQKRGRNRPGPPRSRSSVAGDEVRLSWT